MSDKYERTHSVGDGCMPPHDDPAGQAISTDGRAMFNNAGEPIANATVDEWVAEAEAGYDVDRVIRKGTHVDDFPELWPGGTVEGEWRSADICQVVMHGQFFNTFFVPLLRQQGFLLAEMEQSDEERAADMRTFSVVFGPRRAQLLKDMP